MINIKIKKKIKSKIKDKKLKLSNKNFKNTLKII